jgi:hypothetical protein
MVDYKDRYWDMLRKPGISKLVMDDLLVQALRQIVLRGSAQSVGISLRRSRGFRARSILFQPLHSGQNRYRSQAFPRKTIMNAQRFTYSIWLVRPQRRETPAVSGKNSWTRSTR